MGNDIGLQLLQVDKPVCLRVLNLGVTTRQRINSGL
jgi:hypothetical protein